MEALLGICAVVVTLAIAGIAIAIMRSLKRFEVTADEFSRTAEVLRSTIAEVHELTESMGAVVPPLQRAASRMEDLSDRAARISNSVLNEIEGPIRNTVAVITGVRTGTRSLIGALTNRIHKMQPRTHANGGTYHE